MKHTIFTSKLNTVNHSLENDVKPLKSGSQRPTKSLAFKQAFLLSRLFLASSYKPAMVIFSVHVHFSIIHFLVGDRITKINASIQKEEK